MCDDFKDDFDDPCEDGDYDGMEWQDWMIIGPLSEGMARKWRVRDKIEQDVFGEDD